ncbi:MAG: leucine-rich repeat domain-containing protein, partial [Oscillospiraceae bacterium]|nr:leucine-rich repeat domain-containing protein [Oscillospiraceae bacterium]
FYDCTSLTSVTIPDSVTNIGKWAFGYCTSLTSVTIGDSVTHIGAYAFYKCTSLTSVTIGDSVTSIGNSAFRYCTSLTSVTIPNGVTSIGEHAFANCPSLYVHIPDSVTTIGSSILYHSSAYICSDTAESYAKEYAEANGIEFRVCEGHHNYVSSVTAPTCTEQGYTTHTCTTCGDTYTDSVVDALGHAYDSTVTKEATCTEKGKMTYTCSRCGDSYTEDIAEIPHTEKTVRIEPTCTADGKHYTACSVCGATLGTVTVLPMIDHAFGEWVTVTEPTLEAEGLQECACTYGCGTKETQVLPKIPSKTAEDEDSGVMLTYPDAAYEGDVELKVSQVFDGTAFNLVALNSDKNVVYDITTMKDGVAVQPSSTVIVRIPVPVGFDPAKCVVYHVSTETGKLERMPARYENGYMVFETTHFSYYAIAIEKTPQAVVAIRNFAENRTIDYRTTLTFNATVEYGVDGAEIHWFVDGKDMGTGDTYTMKEAKKNFIVQAKYMKDGKVLAESETETVTVKTGFFDKLKAFFRALFRKLPVVVQEYLGVEIIDRVLP